MDKRYEKLLESRDYVRSRTDFRPKVALVLGSGLGGFASELEVACEVPYADIPGFPVSTVPGHAGKFIFGTLEGVPVVPACRAGCISTRATTSPTSCCPPGSCACSARRYSSSRTPPAA